MGWRHSKLPRKTLSKRPLDLTSLKRQLIKGGNSYLATKIYLYNYLQELTAENKFLNSINIKF